MKELSIIQQGLKAPKTERNGFGKYLYRKASDILLAVKPFLAESNTSIVLDDTITEVGGRVFLKATATLLAADGNTIRQTDGWAELDTHAGMCKEQATGAASSYARKYALCGLLAIDDSSLDPDSLEPKPATQPYPAQQPDDELWRKIQAAQNVGDINALMPEVKGATKAHKDAFLQRARDLRLAYSDIDKEYVETV